MALTIVEMGTAFKDPPLRRTRETGFWVVGCQVIWNA
jgi:hypothetical protein